MGCWNETCELSNLPICWENKVKFLILLNVGLGGKNYYYNDAYAPLALPLSGTYDDYGSVENIEIDETTLKFLSSTQFYTLDDENKEISDEKIARFSNVLKNYGCSFISINEMNSILNYKKYEFKDIKQFVDDICRESIFLKHNDTYYFLQIIMYHEDLYESLVESFKLRIPYNKKDNIYTLWNQKLKKYFKERQEYIELKKIPEDDMDSDTIKKLIRFEFSEPIFKTSQYGYNFIKQYEDYIDKEHFDEFIDLLTNYIILTYVLSYGRNGYYSSSGLGSQGEERFIQKQIAQWIIDFYNEKEEKAAEYADEDSDEDYGMSTVYWFE